MLNLTAGKIHELAADVTPKYAVEFGALDGTRSNIILLLKDGWKGTWIEPSRESFSKLQKRAKKAGASKITIVYPTF